MPELHRRTDWTYPRAGGPDSAAACCVTLREHLPLPGPQFPHLYGSFGWLFILHVSEHVWGREEE